MPDSQIPPPPSIQEDPDRVIFSARDLAFELLVTKAILRSLEIDQILYVVLSGVTSGEGLGFNRGLLLLADDGQRKLRTSMAIGPTHLEEARRIWEDMLEKDLTLEALLAAYEAVKNDPKAHRLSRRLRHLELHLDHLADIAEAVDNSQAPVAVTRIEPTLARCLLDRKPYSSRDVALRCEGPGDDEAFQFENWWMVPLLTPERIVGVLVVDDAFSKREASAGVQHLLVAISNLTAIAIEKEKLFQEMRALARIDGLTGLANRRSYEAELERALTRARQTGRPMSLIVLDIDNFKQYNDRNGHLAGDDVLRFAARIFKANARKSDIIARYGGEEFAVVLPDAGYEQAMKVAQKLVTAVREESARGAEVAPITISAGIAVSPGGELDATSLFEAADAALYRAKREGRNRALGARPADPSRC